MVGVRVRVLEQHLSSKAAEVMSGDSALAKDIKV